jgi:2-methylisocitrate lyase-like PEP mutase family enzyme
MSESKYTARRARFAELHRSGCFVMPNPWDPGSTMMLEHLGYSALATTSSGFSFSQGLPDMDWAVPVERELAHIAEIVGATNLPVNADYESGYAHDIDGLMRNVKRCADTGVAGLSIEDATGDKANPLYPFDVAVERVAAAATALKGTGVLLTARCEGLLVGHPQARAEIARRMPAFAAAGADVLYAPGLKTKAEISEFVTLAGAKPVNLLVSSPIGLTVADIAALGVRRISIGSGLARAAWGGFLRAARTLKESGSFEQFRDAEPFAALNDFFRSKER